MAPTHKLTTVASLRSKGEHCALCTWNSGGLTSENVCFLKRGRTVFQQMNHSVLSLHTRQSGSGQQLLASSFPGIWLQVLDPDHFLLSSLSFLSGIFQLIFAECLSCVYSRHTGQICSPDGHFIGAFALLLSLRHGTKLEMVLLKYFNAPQVSQRRSWLWLFGLYSIISQGIICATQIRLRLTYLRGIVQ